MGEIKYPEPKKIICGFIYSAEPVYEKAAAEMKMVYGETDFVSEPVPFIHTRYYGTEGREGLKRRFISFKKNADPGLLPDIKITANELEKKYLRENGERKINIDPGMLSMAKVILATTKNYQHRIYAGKGIFAEVTLRYSGKKKSFIPWEWTYPDYAAEEYINIFNKIRQIYALSLVR
ncbi:MAG: DUF4416 family protein [Candidatus Goldiibacteriota bacterium]